MSLELVRELLSKGDLKRKLQFQLISQCAPFLKGIKVSCILNIEEEARDILSELFEGTDISYEILTTSKKKFLVLFYRDKTLKKHLQKQEVQEFLKVYGYESSSMEGTLEHLKHRVEEFSKHDICFPHEIGAFLDYPIDDVKCFINQGTKEALFVGYWKVYNHPDAAKNTFAAYDEAIDDAVQEFLQGKTLQEIAA